MTVPLAWLLASAITAAPPLIDAARRGGPQAVRALIEQKTDVNAKDGDGATALLWASYQDDLESVRLLIAAGADVNASNDLGATPLWAASQNGSVAIVRELLAAKADPNAALLAGETPLMVAARSGKAGVVELLLAKGANPDVKATRGQTALMWAVAQRHPTVVKQLLDKGANVHARSESWTQMMAVPPHGYPPYNRQIPHGACTPLLFAARVGDIESARLLLAAGANPNDRDAWGVSATVLAAHSGFRDIAALLLEKGADPNSAEAGFSALHIAIFRRDRQLVSMLLERGADSNAPLRTWTPTRRSSRDFHFQPELVGATPFWLAARFHQPEVMRLLVKHGADARFVHHAEFVVEKGFKQRKETVTPVMAAAGMGGGAAWVDAPPEQREALVLEAVKLAVELGNDPAAANDQGRTALDAARASKYESVAKYLAEKTSR